MTHDDERVPDELLRALRAEYNVPPDTPREEMWAEIRSGLLSATRVEPSKVVDLESRRARPTRSVRRMAGWAVAAAALLVLGVGIGRMSTPAPATVGDEVAAAAAGTAFRTAAVEHLSGSEALLSVVRSDASTGQVDPQLRQLARGMLAQTRLFLDASEQGTDPELRRLMEDLELVLAQIVAVDENGERSRTELELALDGLQDREVLARIRTLSEPGLAGT